MTATKTHSLTTLFDELENRPLIKSICSVFESQNCDVVIVGGLIRDYLRYGSIAHDIDLIVPADKLDSLASHLAEALSGKVIPLDEVNGVLRVVIPDSPDYLDLAACQGESILVDLARRDLSINAMALNLSSGEVLDPYNGQVDLQHQRIRSFEPQNLIDDPLRMLRVFRFLSAFEQPALDEITLQTIQAHVEKIHTIAEERIQAELFRLLSNQNASEALQKMHYSGLLSQLFALPETPLDTALSLNQCLSQIETDLTESLQAYLESPLTPVLSHRGALRLLLLLNETSVKSLAEIGKTQKWPNSLTQTLTRVLKNTTQSLPLQEADYLQLNTAQGQAAGLKIMMTGLTLWKSDTTLSSKINTAWGDAVQFDAREKDLPQLLSGDDLQHILQITPGPIIGQLLEALRSAQRRGEVVSQDDARQWIRENHPVHSTATTTR